MQVLVYFDKREERVAFEAMAELGKRFSFRLELLTSSKPRDLSAWNALSEEAVVVLKARQPFEQAIRKMCAKKHYDLVMAAPSDRRGILRLLLGSRLGRFAGVPPATIWVPRGYPHPIRRVLVGISGGPQSEQDARLAARVAVAYGADLILVHVVSQLPLLYTTPGEFQSAVANAGRLALLDPGARELQRIYDLLLKEGVRVELMVREGVVIDELIDACHGGAEYPPADLLVIGAHAPSGAGGTDYFVNLAEQITQAVSCPTLVVHAEADLSAWTIVQRESA